MAGPIAGVGPHQQDCYGVIVLAHQIEAIAMVERRVSGGDGQTNGTAAVAVMRGRFNRKPDAATSGSEPRG